MLNDAFCEDYKISLFITVQVTENRNALISGLDVSILVPMILETKTHQLVLQPYHEKVSTRKCLFSNAAAILNFK